VPLKGLLYGGAGAGVGAALAAAGAGSVMGPLPAAGSDVKQRLKNALIGALQGGAIMGGVGLLSQYAKEQIPGLYGRKQSQVKRANPRSGNLWYAAVDNPVPVLTSGLDSAIGGGAISGLASGVVTPGNLKERLKRALLAAGVGGAIGGLGGMLATSGAIASNPNANYIATARGLHRINK